MTNVAWNTDKAVATITTPPYQKDGDASAAFTAKERSEIVAIWRAVSDAYAAFDVDVTTQDPGGVKGSWGTWVCVGGSSKDWCVSCFFVCVCVESAFFARWLLHSQRSSSSTKTKTTKNRLCPTSANGCAGGIAYTPAFGEAQYQPAFVFQQGAVSAVWKAAIHEIGHTFGLLHGAVVVVVVVGCATGWLCGGDGCVCRRARAQFFSAPAWLASLSLSLLRTTHTKHQKHKITDGNATSGYWNGGSGDWAPHMGCACGVVVCGVLCCTALILPPL